MEAKLTRLLETIILSYLLIIIEMIAIYLIFGLQINLDDLLVTIYLVMQGMVIYYSLYKLNISPLNDIVVKWF